MTGQSSDNPGMIRLLTFNLQVGIHTQAYHHYLTRSWQHLLPNRRRDTRLAMISDTLKAFDLVALQEVDGGSFRSGNVNQVEYLAEQAGFPTHYQQINRNLGRLAQHSNGLLSRLPPGHITNHRLPGPPGRGAIHARFGEGPEALHVFVVHLALGVRTRNQQLDYLGELISPLHHVVVMGDLNCTPEQLHAHRRFCRALDMRQAHAIPSYPAWQPSRALDHILLSSSLTPHNLQALSPLFSDHLPLAVDIQLPLSCTRTINITSQGHTQRRTGA
ncbi:endonuclease/exonuclease/phosphatase family metal-dependent hydrolase [Kushneria sinocarnis]|uniref:Endonuclease/exonuclease/phosphatase family metal-dependent hydrolase n=1 Tax=Kushneria sinocarnis TaxID=595502 RepID=A0A420X124_9GAMM|nr:endonuclease/exonuclease/phosphatase family protein [Kushneria sinocarnis]RKR07450.1 endonuclease/exonuclease/phosphatase family metal-dependent hydrolase [Kushneria sinocarnis]